MYRQKLLMPKSLACLNFHWTCNISDISVTLCFTGTYRTSVLSSQHSRTTSTSSRAQGVKHVLPIHARYIQESTPPLRLSIQGKNKYDIVGQIIKISSRGYNGEELPHAACSLLLDKHLKIRWLVSTPKNISTRRKGHMFTDFDSIPTQIEYR